MQEIDKVVFTGQHVKVGQWRLPCHHPRFPDSGPIERYVVVFPRTSVRITHEADVGFVADPTICTVYYPGQCYERGAIDPTGDNCDWWSVDSSVAREITSAIGERAAIESHGAFSFKRGPVDAALYLFQRGTLHGLLWQTMDALEAEERVLAVISRALVLAAGMHTAPPPLRPAHEDLATSAKEMLGRGFRRQLTLDAIAQELGVTPFHLCRVFKAQTGSTIHRHLNRIRLRSALEQIPGPKVDICRIGLESGFCSHSHFTSAFVGEFGITPSAWRYRAAMH